MGNDSQRQRTDADPLGPVTHGFELDSMRHEFSQSTGMYALMGIPSASFWLDPSLNRMLSPLADEVGLEMFRLLVAWSSSLGTEEDYEAMVTVFASRFDEGFLRWGKAVGTIGWGRFEMPIYDPANQHARVVVRNTWELQMQVPNERRWGCPFIQGKLIGLFSVAFGTTCWADEVDISYDPADQYVVFDIRPDDRTIHAELSRLRGERAAVRSRANQRLEALQTERDVAYKANQAKTRFLAAMSHELRTPLNAILGYTEMVREELTDRGLDEAVTDLQRVVDAGSYLLQLVSRLLHLSRLETDSDAFRAEDVELTACVAKLVRLVRTSVERRGNRLEIRIDAADSAVLRTDETKLIQILANLLGNAGKFTEQGTVTLDVRDHEDDVVFTVTDTGIGIPEDRQSAIFDMFTQGDQSVQHRYGGVGLGLAISERLARVIGSRLSLQSEVGRGTTVSLTVPRSPAP
ncbi:MAG: HAMP domain-containing histidine kinase [Myxococcales bacterium]|nr:HAMP domain-containing histidine kinase [Myxococcales bacterium]